LPISTAAADAALLGGQPVADVVKLAQQINEAMLASDTARIIEVAQRLGALARELKQPQSEEMAALAIATAYELRSDARMTIASYSDVITLLDKEPDGGSREWRGDAQTGIGLAWLQLRDRARAQPALEAAVAAYARDGTADPDKARVAKIALAEAMIDNSHAHE